MTQLIMVIVSVVAIVAGIAAIFNDENIAFWGLLIISNIWSAASILYGKLI